MDLGSNVPELGGDTPDSSGNAAQSPFSSGASSAVVTIGDGTSSGPVPAFTLRIGDIVATAPIINFPPPTQPSNDEEMVLVKSTSKFSTGISTSGRPQPGVKNPMVEYVIGSPFNRPRSHFGHETFSTINTDFVGSAASAPLIEPPEFTLSNLVEQLEDYNPTIPDSVANHFLHTAGFDSTDPRVTRLVSLASQKFVYDILKGSFTICKAKAAAAAAVSGKALPKDAKRVLTFEDMAEAADEYKLAVQKSCGST